MLKRKNKKIEGLLVVVELIKLEGRSKFNFPIESIIEILKDKF